MAIKQMQQTYTHKVDSRGLFFLFLANQKVDWTLAVGRVARQSTKDDEDVADI